MGGQGDLYEVRVTTHHRITYQKLVALPSFAQLALRHASSSLMSRADVIVLGGGIIGCALAEELARRKRRVVVIERGSIGAEASSAAAGILSAQMDAPTPGAFFDLCQAARRAYPAWVARIERASGQRVGYARSGVLYLAVSDAQARRMQQRAIWQRRLGLRVERWTMAQVRRREPAVDGGFRCGFHFPLEGQVDNALLMRALAQACRSAGVRVREQVTARRLILSQGRVRGVETSQSVIRADVVVNTLGSWSPMIAGFPGRLPVEPARGQIVCLAGPKRLFHRPIMTDRAYLIQRRDGRLLLGSTVERAGFDKSVTLEGMYAILSGVRTISSRLDACAYVDSWAGLRPYSRTGYPILGRTGVEGVYVATGHFRHGILLAPITAALMTDLILRGRSSFDLTPFSLGRFDRKLS